MGQVKEQKLDFLLIRQKLKFQISLHFFKKNLLIFFIYTHTNINNPPLVYFKKFMFIEQHIIGLCISKSIFQLEPLRSDSASDYTRITVVLNSISDNTTHTTLLG